MPTEVPGVFSFIYFHQLIWGNLIASQSFLYVCCKFLLFDCIMTDANSFCVYLFHNHTVLVKSDSFKLCNVYFVY